MSERPGSAIHFDEFSGYVAAPDGPPRGGVIVIHEIWGLVDHIKDVADRYAEQGYLAIAPDILSHGGVTPEVGAWLEELRESPDEEERIRLQPAMREAMTPLNQPEYAEWAVAALKEVIDWLGPQVEGKVLVTGFCFGGTYSFALAAADQRVRAAAPFYGAPPMTTEYVNFDCPIHAFYGRNDPRLMEGLPEVRARMRAAQVDFEATIYEDAGHAFFNDTASRAYVPAAATDAWQKVLAFFEAALED